MAPGRFLPRGPSSTARRSTSTIPCPRPSWTSGSNSEVLYKFIFSGNLQASLVIYAAVTYFLSFVHPNRLPSSSVDRSARLHSLTLGQTCVGGSVAHSPLQWMRPRSGGLKASSRNSESSSLCARRRRRNLPVKTSCRVRGRNSAQIDDKVASRAEEVVLVNPPLGPSATRNVGIGIFNVVSRVTLAYIFSTYQLRPYQ